MKPAHEGDILPYSDRKELVAQRRRWSSEEIVRAQCLACEGMTADKIIEALNAAGMALGCDVGDVIRVIDNDPVQSKAKTREAVAGVGHAKAKSRW